MRAVIFCMLGVLGSARGSVAEWPTDPTVNVGVVRSTGNQIKPVMTTDGAGGALLAWMDFRYNNWDVFGARVLLDGSQPWQFNGQSIQDSTGDEQSSVIAADGAGGAVLAWTFGFSSSSLYVQRVDGGGARLWGRRGILIATNAYPSPPRLVHDGQQGAIVAWSTCKFCQYAFVRAQRIGPDGSLLWPPGGVVVATGTGAQDEVAVAADGTGGVFVAWLDSRGGLYAQRLHSDGGAAWTPNGVSFDAGGEHPHLVADGAGGVFAGYVKNSSVDYVYAQHLDALGQLVWGAGGVSVSVGGWGSLVPDAAGGVIVGFDDSGESSTLDRSNVHAQRIGANGSLQWGTGVSICAAPYTQRSTRIVADGAGGGYLVWQDSRATQAFGPYDIFAQRVDGGGQVQWQADGIPVCTASGDQFSPAAVLSGVGGLLVCWEDHRGPAGDVYVQHVGPDGTLGLVVSDTDGPHARTGLQLRVANPVRSELRMQLRLDAAARVTLQVYDAAGHEHLMHPLGLVSAGTQAFGVDLSSLPSGVYILSLTAGGTTASRKVTILR